MELHTFPNDFITLAPLNEIQLRSWKVLIKTNSTMVIQEEQLENNLYEDGDTPAIE
jgi:hypothetical protein